MHALYGGIFHRVEILAEGDQQNNLWVETTTIEFHNPTPTRRRLSGGKQTSFDWISTKSQRESVMILDEVRRGEDMEGYWVDDVE